MFQNWYNEISKWLGQRVNALPIDGGTKAEIRVRVSPTPYAREARENYADSWRTKS